MVSVIIDPSIRSFLDAAQKQKLRKELRRMIIAASRRDFDNNDLEVTFCLTNDQKIQKLNSTYRNKEQSTDVLAFAVNETTQFHPNILGDVIISLETADRQRKQSLYDETMFLAAHGFCHLLGYDHNTDHEETEMNQRAANLLIQSRGNGVILPA